jgi:hypothetical protein
MKEAYQQEGLQMLAQLGLMLFAAGLKMIFMAALGLEMLA